MISGGVATLITPYVIEWRQNNHQAALARTAFTNSIMQIILN
jgi:hypothetical protein